LDQIESHKKPNTSAAPYVLAQLVSAPDNIIIVLSTQNCLQNIIEQANFAPSILFIDSTFCLNTLNYPTILIGTTDILRQTRLIAAAVTKTEESENYEFILN